MPPTGGFAARRSPRRSALRCAIRPIATGSTRFSPGSATTRAIDAPRFAPYIATMARHAKSSAPSQRMLRVGELVRHQIAALLARGEIIDDLLETLTVT